MKRKKNEDLVGGAFEIQLKGIELLRCNQRIPTTETIHNLNFEFNVNIETKADLLNKILLTIIHIDIQTEDQSQILGGISVSYIFELKHFEEVIKIASGGKPHLPQTLVDMMNSISLSTTRGVMFAAFKGTSLHHALLPIMDPKQCKLGQKE
jgi:hypothetical protein